MIIEPPKTPRIYEVPSEGDSKTLSWAGKTTECQCELGTLRATSDLTLELVTPKGEVLTVPGNSVGNIRDTILHADIAIREWRRTITGQRIPKIWTRDDGKVWCEWLGDSGELVKIYGRVPGKRQRLKHCRICDQVATCRWEAKRVAWNTPHLPLLCVSCFERFQVAPRRIGKIEVVK